jgi:hypothetical protein
MKPISIFLTTFTLRLAAAPLAFAQNYYAGPYLGELGAENTHVGAYAGRYDPKPGNRYFRLGYMPPSELIT